MLRIVLHLKQLSDKASLHKPSENLPFSRNIVVAKRKRRGQGRVIWTEDNKRSDANHIAWINLIQSNTTHCAKLGSTRAQESYIDTSTTQVTVSDLFGGFSFCGMKKLKGGNHESTPQPRGKNTVKRNSERRIPRKSSENRRLFTGANLVLRPAWRDTPPQVPLGGFFRQLGHVIGGGHLSSWLDKLTWQDVTCQVIWRQAGGEGDKSTWQTLVVKFHLCPKHKCRTLRKSHMERLLRVDGVIGFHTPFGIVALTSSSSSRFMGLIISFFSFFFWLEDPSQSGTF